MAWNQVTLMEQKHRFVSLAATGRFTFTELCADFHVSRKTGHKWVVRYRKEGAAGLRERSRRPHGCAHQTAARIEQLILRERRKHRTWGPKKLRRLLRRDHRIRQPPACSTIAGILRRSGLSQRPRRKPGLYEVSRHALTVPTHPNHVWTVDFKGWFTLGNGQRCDPLTVCDLFSRYYLACRARPNQQFAGTLRAFHKLMRRHGLPEIIRVDNGTPFASLALGRLSQLSAWWINQGIIVEFIQPASPQQNGSHERGHRDLKAEATQPPSPTMAAQQRRFDRGNTCATMSDRMRRWGCSVRPKSTAAVPGACATTTLPCVTRRTGWCAGFPPAATSGMTGTTTTWAKFSRTVASD